MTRTDLERLRDVAQEIDERWSEFWERSVSGYDASRSREKLREARAALHAALEIDGPALGTVKFHAPVFGRRGFDAVDSGASAENGRRDH